MNLPPVLVSRRSPGRWRPELTLSPGPVHLAQPGAGSYAELYGCPWALALHKVGPQLYQLDAGAWVPRADPGGALTELVRGVRHVALAWDQAARPVVAWELAGQVYVRQWSPGAVQYVTRGPWAGWDPVLYTDAAAHYSVPSSDVLLLHLDAAQQHVIGRVQRDLYGVPAVMGTVPPGAVLDQVVSLAYRWQLLGEADGAQLVLHAPLYPLGTADTLSGSGALKGGAVVALVSRDTYDAGEALTGAGALDGGALLSLVQTATAADTLTGAGALDGGALLSLVQTATAADTLTGAGALTGGTFVTGTHKVARTDALTGTAALGGGAYG